MAATTSALAQDTSVPDLPKAAAALKVSYEAELARFAKPLATLDEQYGQRLEALKKQAEARGDLDAVLAYQQAIASLGGAGSPTPEGAAEKGSTAGKKEGPADLAGSEKIYLRERDRLKAIFRNEKAPLQKKYFSALEKLVVSSTRGGQIEDAVVVKKYLAEQRAIADSEKSEHGAAKEGEPSSEKDKKMNIVRAVYGKSVEDGKDVTDFMVNLQKTNGLVRVPHATWVSEKATGNEKLFVELGNKMGKTKTDTFEKGYLWKAAQDLP